MKKIYIFAAALLATASVAAQEPREVQMTLHNASSGGDVIPREIYGQFAEHLGRCIYGGIWVGEDSEIPNEQGYRVDVLEALRALKVPVLRWPGGCFADEYHWMDGIGPREKRPKMINTHWGGTVEDNSFGTHEFLNFCELLGCEPYVNGNVGSGSVEELSKWIEYMTSDADSPMANLRRENGRDKPWKVKYIGVGNESWGCGGNMYPEYYSDLYRRYATYCREYPGNRLYKIACGANGADYNWTEVVMKRAGGMMNGLSLHYYTVYDWGRKGSATQFDDEDWYAAVGRCAQIENIIKGHCDIMDRYDPARRIGLIVDEWGTWWDEEPGTVRGHLYQQNTLRDAMVAAVTLNIFHKYVYRVKMANIAQMVNVLQSVILTDGADMILTPTYHVFDMYKSHQDAVLVDSTLETEQIGLEEEWQVPNLTESVSEDAEGKLHITVTNLSASESYPIDAVLVEYPVGTVSGEIVSGDMHEKNTFEAPDCVQVRSFDGVSVTEKGLSFTIPPCAVVHLTVTRKA